MKQGRDLALMNGKLPLHESHAEWGNKRQRANASMGLPSIGIDTFLHMQQLQQFRMRAALHPSAADRQSATPPPSDKIADVSTTAAIGKAKGS